MIDKHVKMTHLGNVVDKDNVLVRVVVRLEDDGVGGLSGGSRDHCCC